MTESNYSGGCLCGAVRYNSTAAPTRCMICHCDDCKKHSGGPCLSFVHFPKKGFTWTTVEPNKYRSSKYAKRGFCGECGSTISMHEEVLADRVQVALGSLDNPNAVTPDDHVWCSSRVTWFEQADDLPKFDQSSSAVPSKATEK